MLSAARSQRACPQCRLRLLTLFETGFASPCPEPRALTRPTAPSTGVLRSQRRSNARLFSTTRHQLQDVPPETPARPGTPPEKPYDIGLAVRQAKHTFGDTLPKGYLNEEEYQLYERLYGKPLRETRPEDVGMPIPAGVSTEEVFDLSRKVLLRETDEGHFEEVIYEVEELLEPNPDDTQAEIVASPEAVDGAGAGVGEQEMPSELGLSYIHAVAKNQREYNALLKLQKDFELASLQAEEEIAKEARANEEDEVDEEKEVEEEDEEDEGEEEDEGMPDAAFERVHQYTKMGQWRTNPSSVHLPKVAFVNPISKLLTRTDIKHVKMAAENACGGPGLPYSVATPASRRNSPQNPIAIDSVDRKLSEIDADVFIATNLPGMYSSVMSILVEVRKRLGSEWITNLMSRENGEGPRVLDVGAGGAGLAAWQKVLKAEWDLAREEGKIMGDKSELDPPGKKTVVVASEHLRQRISRFLHNTTFLPRLPDYLHSGSHPDRLDGSESSLPRKQFDIIIASHRLMRLPEGFRRNAYLDNLWEMLSPEGGVLIVLEKGHPRGFEAVADVRSRLLDEFIVTPASDPRPGPIESEQKREREQGMIIAPCTTHKACPMYLTPGLTPGRKDFCHFSQRFIRPPFLQQILGASHRNHEDINFSFVAVQRGVLPGMEKVIVPDQGKETTNDAFAGYENAPEPPHPLSLPRSVLPPLKRQRHVILELCTPAGTIERWMVPKSFSRQAYRDARKFQWGSLWALGAKTRVSRPIRLGKNGPAPNDGGVRAREATQGGKKGRVINLEGGPEGIHRSPEKTGRQGPPERRTKGGKKVNFQEFVKELEDSLDE
ncbi:Rsm22-domain-containing protein [Biscogniauxia marginata]|nr:Rsm22-domain-containing protein [Biscogniauxia marginata]